MEIRGGDKETFSFFRASLRRAESHTFTLLAPPATTTAFVDSFTIVRSMQLYTRI